MNVTHLAIGLFNATWQSAALILATALGLRACRNVGARARCMLWSAVFFLSALLPLADLAMQRTLVVAPHGPEALPARATALYTRPHAATANHRRARVAADIATAPAARVQPAAVAPARAENPFVAPALALQSLAGVLLALYLFGVVFFAVRLARECFVLLALKRRCTPIDGDPFLLGRLPRGARVATSEEIEIPCVLGFIRPLVVLPADMIGDVSPADLRRVVGHEAAHLERYDDWTNLIEQLVLAAFFYNPAMHFAVRQIATEREIACDDRVVMREGDTVTYAECLATLVHRAGATRRLPVPGFHAGPRQIVVRIERLLDRAYLRSRRFGAGIAVTASAVVLLAVTGVGNTVPVLSDAVAPPAAPAPPVVAPKLAVPAAKPVAAAAKIPAPSMPAMPKIDASMVKIAMQMPKLAQPLPKIAAYAPRATMTELYQEVKNGAESQQYRYVTVVAEEQTAPVAGHPAAGAPVAGSHPPGTPAAPSAWPRRSDSLIDALAAAGYGHLSVDELVGLSDSGISGHTVAEYARLFGHPSVDDLKALADHGVSPSYVERVEAAGLHSINVRDAIRLADNGISPHDVSNALRILRSPPSVDDIIRLHNSGVE
ncbi:MAG TPA: M56 family metallopeptidase [Candidatus Acidoferrales bacterium]|jgi:beta-lactamase regulating signal transducer with metallopeptidase domain|nr:M56 family metallopeptidase [Candidatus Acidoferrales bacterium]